MGHGATSVSGECYFFSFLNMWWCVVFYCFVIMVVCIVLRLVFMSCSVMVSGYLPMFVVYIVLLNAVCFLSLGV